MENKKTGYPHIDRPWMKYYEGEYIPEDEPKTNMVEVLKMRNKWRKSKTAYEYYGKRVSYDEMWDRVNTASKVLSDLGVKQSDIILSMVPNIPEEEELWFGATQIGAITDYIDPRPDSMDPVANSKKLLEIIKYEKPKYIVAADKCYLWMIKPIENELKELGINDVIILHASDSMDDLAMYEYLKDVVNYEKLKSGKYEINDDIPLEELLMLTFFLSEPISFLFLSKSLLLLLVLTVPVAGLPTLFCGALLSFFTISLLSAAEIPFFLLFECKSSPILFPTPLAISLLGLPVGRVLTLGIGELTLFA